MNKQELKSMIFASREQLEAAIARISDERMSLVILHGEWSVKDLVGHLGFWERRVVFLFSILQAGEIPEPYEDMDALNDQAVADMRLLSLAEVRRHEETAYQDILSLIDEASDQELFDPDHFAWTEGRSFETIISDNTWDHYDEHLPELIAWLKRIA